MPRGRLLRAVGTEIDSESGDPGSMNAEAGRGQALDPYRTMGLEDRGRRWSSRSRTHVGSSHVGSLIHIICAEAGGARLHPASPVSGRKRDMRPCQTVAGHLHARRPRRISCSWSPKPWTRRGTTACPCAPGAERYVRELAYQIGRSPGPSSGAQDAPTH